MVAHHYRWDFIGLSTDSKPTPATSEKVTDGSTFYETNTSKLYVWYKDQWYEKETSGGGELPIASAETLGGIKVGSNLSINSETGVLSATDTTYSAFTGTDGTAAGASGLVPAPATTDAGKFLKADGTWDTAGGGSGPTVVQTVGTSTTDVMSQDATTKMVFAEDNKNRVSIGGTIGTTTNTPYCVSIGKYATSLGAYNVAIGGGDTTNDIARAYGDGSIAIGKSSKALSSPSASGHGRHIAIGVDSSTGPATSGAAASFDNIAIGSSAKAWANGSIALGAYSGNATMAVGQMDIGSSNTSYGYNSTNYRLLTGLHDPVNDHDAATKAYVDAAIAALRSELTA